ncbi:MAG: LytTR family DNA-binding domain-containing protein [Natronospirillum sp.]
MSHKGMELTAVIADDEPVLRFHLRKLLGELNPSLDVVGMAANGDEAWAMVQTLQPDVIFLDIHMPGQTGLEVASAMQAAGLTARTDIVFLTAYDEYAVDAFQREAVDYLLKPVDDQRLLQTLLRVESRHQTARSSALPDLTALRALLGAKPPTPMLQWINAARGNDVHLIAVSQVLMFHAADKYTTVITTEGEFLIRQSLRQLSAELDSDQFWRVHRSALVQVAAIERVVRTLKGAQVLQLKGLAKPVAVCRRFADQFKPM